MTFLQISVTIFLYMTSLILVINYVVLMYIWFDTNALVEWVKLFKLNKVFNYKEYEEYLLKVNFPLSYLEWVAFKYNNFFTKLFTCPICLSVWINILVTIVLYKKFALLLTGVNIFLTWMIYHILKIIIKKANE